MKQTSTVSSAVILIALLLLLGFFAKTNLESLVYNMGAITLAAVVIVRPTPRPCLQKVSVEDAREL